MRITLGPSVVRGNIDESITGLWSFANALGLLTNVIGERTAAAGVTVDGLLIKDAGIPEAAVTAHETALSILETQIPDGDIFPRKANTEIITGLYVFAHSSGILTDSISERIASAGVTIDGVQLIDGLVHALAIVGGGSLAYRSRVSGESFDSFSRDSRGFMSWGDGAGAQDTNLFRATAGELATDSDFNVGGALDLAGDFDLSLRTMTLSGGATDHDVDTGSVVIQRLDPNGTTAIGGFAGGRGGRTIILNNITSSFLTITHENSGSLAANRIICPNASSFSISGFDGVLFWYDAASLRWRTLALNP